MKRLKSVLFSFIIGLILVAGLLSLLRQTTQTAFADPVEPPEGYPKYITSLKTVTPTLANTGGATLTYRIEIRNTGAYTGEDTTLSDSIPPDTTYNGDATASVSSTFTFSNGVLIWLGDVGFDNMAVISFSVSVDAAFSGTVQNTAVISQALISEPVTLTAETVVTDNPIFVISKEAVPATPGPNKPLTYTILVENWGQSAISLPLTLIDQLPISTTLLEIGPDGTTNPTSSTITWTRSVTLALGQSTNFTFSVMVNDVPSGTVITNDQYQLMLTGGEIVAGEPYTTTVVDPDFLLSKSIWPDPPGSNRPLTYTLSLLNKGSLATSIIITDRVPNGTTYLSGGTENGGIVSWTLPSLETNESAEFTFSVYITDVAGITIVNDLYGACSSEGICQPGEVLTSVVSGPNFIVSAELDPIAKKPGGGGGPVTPTLRVKNIGPGNALDASVLLFFDRISIQGGDLYIDPAIGTPLPFPEGPPCGSNCSSFVWTGNITVGTQLTFSTFTGQSTIGGAEGTNYTTTVVVTDALSNLSTLPISATAVGTVTHFANLYPSKSAPPVIGPGQFMTYSLRVRNGALSTDAPPWLTDTVPHSLTVVSVSDGGVTQTVNGRTVVSWTLPNMGPGDALGRSFMVQVDPTLVSGTLIINDDYQTSWFETQAGGVITRAGLPVTTTVVDAGLIDSYKVVTPVLSLPGPDVVLTYYLHIVNSGALSLTDVTLYDFLPWQDSTYLRDAEASAGTLISDIVSLQWTGDMPAFSEETITLTVLVDEGFVGAITNTAVISHPDLLDEVVIDAVAYITDLPVLMINKTATPDPVGVGEELLYKIRVRNIGWQATELVISDTIPANTTYVPGSASAGGVLQGNTVVWNIPVLNTNKFRDFFFRVTVGGGAPFIVNENYQVSAVEGVVDTGPPVTTTVDFSTVPDLILTKGDSPDPVASGGQLTYTLNISNGGVVTATGVVLTDTLPPEVVFGSASPGCSNNSGIVTCNLGDMMGGTETTVEVIVTVNSGFTGTITNTATVTAVELDANPADNTATETTQVTPAADLAIGKSDSADPAFPGSTLLYTLVITNNGPSDATGVLVTDTLPTEVTFVSAPAGCSENAGIVSCTIGNMAAGTTINLVIEVTVNEGTNGIITNTAIVTATQGDPDPSNNTATEDTTISDTQYIFLPSVLKS